MKNARRFVVKVGSTLVTNRGEGLDVAAIAKMERSLAREAVEAAARGLLPTTAPGLFGEQRELVVQRVVDEAVDLGPLEPLPPQAREIEPGFPIDAHQALVGAHLPVSFMGK